MLPTIEELKQATGLEPNFFIIVHEELDNGYSRVLHMVFYEEEPNQNSIDILFEELNTDEDFGLVGRMDTLHMNLLTKEEYLEMPSLKIDNQ